MYTYLIIPTKFVSIVLFVALLFVLVLTYVFNHKISINFSLKVPATQFIFMLVYFFCLLSILFLPALSETVFISLNSLNGLTWLRTLAALLIGVFLPGYAILSLAKNKLNPVLLTITSLLLSIFINSIITFFAIILVQSVLSWILIVNFSIFTLYFIIAIVKKDGTKTLKSSHMANLNLDNTKLLLLLLCLFQLSILLSIFILSDLQIPSGDMWRHVALANKLAKGDPTRFDILSYPPLFPAHLLSVSKLAGLPVMSVSKILGLINVIVVLAFFSCALKIIKNKAIAFLSTFIFTMFGSLTFLYQAIIYNLNPDPGNIVYYFLISSDKTMRINSIYTLVPNYFFAPASLTLLLVLIITALLLSKYKTRVLYLVEAILMACLFLIHIAETSFIIIFFISALIVGIFKLKDLIFLTMGLWLGTLILSLFSYVGFLTAISIPLIYTAVIFLTILLTRIKFYKKLQTFFAVSQQFLSKNFIKLLLAFLLIFLCGFLLLIWKILYVDGSYSWSGVLSSIGAFPTYFMPITFGVPLFISLLFLVKNLLSKELISKQGKKIVIFLFSSFLMAYIFGKVLTLLEISGFGIYREVRVLQMIGGIVFSILSGYALWHIFKHFRKFSIKRKGILAICLGLLVLMGSGSTFLSSVFWVNRGMEVYTLDKSETEAINFLKEKVNSSDVVLTYSENSNNEVAMTGATIIKRYDLPFKSNSSSITKDFLQLVDYIYLTKHDYAEIQDSDTYFKSILPLMPVIFNNSEITIFSVPQIRSHSDNNSIPVIITGTFESALTKLAILDSLGLNYRVYNEWDKGVFEDNILIILTDDIPLSVDSKKYVEWVQKGGHLIILGGNDGQFANIMGIRSIPKIVFQEFWLSEDSFNDWTFDLAGGLNMTDISVSTYDQYDGVNSLIVNSTKGRLNLSKAREQPLSFPFTIGTRFMLVDNSTAITKSLILRNTLASGVGLWDENFSLDYFYADKIIYDIADISLGCWQKIDLHFPDAKTCYVYLNDTLVFVGPRISSYDSVDVQFRPEYNNTISVWFVGGYSALWNGLYYAVNDEITANGIFSQDFPIKLDFSFNIFSPKASFGDDIQIASWYTLNDEKVAPMTLIKEVGAGKLFYSNFDFSKTLVKEVVDYPNSFLRSINHQLINYTSKEIDITSILPREKYGLRTEIYGSQNLTGSISVASNVLFYENYNTLCSLEFENGTQLSLNTANLYLSSNSPFTFNLNGSMIVNPFQDEYVDFSLINGSDSTLDFILQDEKSLMSVYLDDLSYFAVKKIKVTSYDLPINLILRSPNITVTGTTRFEGAFFNTPFNSIIKSRSAALEIDGTLVYDIFFSDKKADRSFGDYLFLNGSYNYVDALTIQDIEFPINSLLSNPDFVTLTLTIMFLSALIILLPLLFHRIKINFRRRKIN